MDDSWSTVATSGRTESTLWRSKWPGRDNCSDSGSNGGSNSGSVSYSCIVLECKYIYQYTHEVI